MAVEKVHTGYFSVLEEFAAVTEWTSDLFPPIAGRKPRSNISNFFIYRVLTFIKNVNETVTWVVPCVDWLFRLCVQTVCTEQC